MGATAIDTSLPVSTLLRQGTAAAHTTAEKSQGAAWLLGGELDRDEYIRFLMMLWHVYEYVLFVQLGTQSHGLLVLLSQHLTNMHSSLRWRQFTTLISSDGVTPSKLT
jgi:heme oxygenase